jgi:hypothetical protein
MADAPNDPTLQRAREEVIARLETRGVRTNDADSAEDLVELLDAVEDFEESVERAGGDLMVDEPVSGSKASQPDDLLFVLPPRDDGEAARSYIERIRNAGSEAERHRL